MCGVDQDMAYILLGYNAILNKDFVHVHALFDSKHFQKEVENIDLVHSLIRLASNKWSKRSLKVVIEGIVRTHELYKHSDIDDVLVNVTTGAEFETIINLIEALEGNMQSLGQICDHLFFENKSWICTMFSILGTGKFVKENI